MAKAYNPTITVTQGTDYVCWSGTLSGLFDDWQSGGFTCLDSTGDKRDTVRNVLKKQGKYSYYGFEITVTG